MGKIGIETTEYEPEDFDPSPVHPATYAETRREAWRIVNQSPELGGAATAAAVLALAAQMARIADAIEFVVKESV